MNKKPIIDVYCIDGCHGVGKTTTLENFAKATGQTFVDEGFLNQNEIIGSPQSYENERTWVIKWFHRLEEICKAAYQSGKSKVFFDRSPYAACAYVERSANYKNNLKSLEGLINLLFECVNANDKFAIKIHIWILQLNPTKLWDQIQNRLTREPFRRQYHEHEMNHMTHVYNYFKTFTSHVHGIGIVMNDEKKSHGIGIADNGIGIVQEIVYYKSHRKLEKALLLAHSCPGFTVLPESN